MTNESSATLVASGLGWLDEHREMYIRSGGVEGHIMDLTAIGGLKFTTHVLIKCAGRKSGKMIITPLIYGNMGGEVVICASKGGADHHPAWYLNIKASKEIYFQIATQAYRATWREPVGAERAKVWNFMEGIYPPYTAYQKSTTRQIPLVMLFPVAPAEVFKQ